MDIVALSKMDDKELVKAIKLMTEEEVEALLILIERLRTGDWTSQLENYLLNM